MKLSKSQYIRGLNCHKSLWLNKNKPHLLENKNNADNQNIHTGNEVGKLARELFSGGTLVEFDSKNFAGMITKTSELIKSGASVIYEASFSVGGIFVMVDILQKVGDKSDNKWNIIEVKSTTSILDNKSKKLIEIILMMLLFNILRFHKFLILIKFILAILIIVMFLKIIWSWINYLK
jgi:hypothetical protein